MSGFKLQRLGMIMEPEPGNPHEVEGVLNPGVARGPDGELYLFPRLVAKGNYSRIGIARVRFNEAGNPVGAERLGIALEPEADYERRPDGGGGCEDPRVTYRGTTPTLHHDLRGIFSSRDQESRWRSQRISSTGNVSGSQPMLIGTASNWLTWTIRMRACFLSRSQTPPENWNWECSIVRCFPALVQRRLLAILDP